MAKAKKKAVVDSRFDREPGMLAKLALHGFAVGGDPVVISRAGKTYGTGATLAEAFDSVRNAIKDDWVGAANGAYRDLV